MALIRDPFEFGSAYDPTAGGEHVLTESDPHNPYRQQGVQPRGGQGTSQSPRVLSGMGLNALVSHATTYYQAPQICLVDLSATILIPLSKLNPGFDPMDPNQLGAALAVATAGDKMKLAKWMAAWKTRFPWAPDAVLFMTLKKGFSTYQGDQVAISVTRPWTEYDPVLMNPPPIPKGDPRENIFAAALRIFFPDYVFDVKGKSPGFYHGYGFGSFTPDGPFPLDVLYVSDRMIDFAIAFMKAGGFGDPAINESMSAQGQALQAAGTIGSMAAAGGVPGAIAGAAVSVGRFLVSLFDNSDPEPPAWLKMLLHMKDLREAGITPPSFGSVRPHDLVKGPITCHRAIIMATRDGKYNIMDGYAEFLQRLSGKKKTPWGWIAAAVGGAAILAGGG